MPGKQVKPSACAWKGASVSGDDGVGRREREDSEETSPLKTTPARRVRGKVPRSQVMMPLAEENGMTRKDAGAVKRAGRGMGAARSKKANMQHQ